MSDYTLRSGCYLHRTLFWRVGGMVEDTETANFTILVCGYYTLDCMFNGREFWSILKLVSKRWKSSRMWCSLLHWPVVFFPQSERLVYHAPPQCFLIERKLKHIIIIMMLSNHFDSIRIHLNGQLVLLSRLQTCGVGAPPCQQSPRGQNAALAKRGWPVAGKLNLHFTSTN